MSEPSKLPFRAELADSPKRVEEVNPHSHSLEPLFDVVPVVIVKMPTQIVTREGSQIATSIDEKLCVGDILSLGESTQERRRRGDPKATEHVISCNSFDSVPIPA